MLYNIITMCTLFYITVGTLSALVMLHYGLKYLQVCCEVFQFTMLEAKQTRNRAIRQLFLVTAHKQHVYLTRIWVKLVQLYKWPMLVQFTSGGLLVALILITHLIKFDFLSLGQLLAYVCGTLMMGRIGEEIIALSEKLRNTTFYSCPWDGDVKSAKFLMFMHLNSFNGFVLPLGNYGAYSNALVFYVDV
ncbi:uncharacterized protein [Atheta coriaria]|uniref:uncharacterized protein isoform X2 n=1 Tax=Dalotia coriaria TaxID=877792 RepID=UPI0031F438FB